MSLIIFSHGNSFPGSTYEQMFVHLRAQGHVVRAVDMFGHENGQPSTRYRVTSNWPHLVEQLVDFASEQVIASGEPAFLVGHSLGGFLSVMTAAKHPHLARGVVLLDSPLIHGWKAAALRLAKKTALAERFSPGAVSKNRRDHWPNLEAVINHFAHKKTFANWDKKALRDYAEHGTRNENGQRVLCFSRAVETQIYNALPDHLERLLKTHPLQCPAAFIGGRQSEEVRRVGTELTEKITQGRMHWLDGTHLFPMEHPRESAQVVSQQLRALLQMKNGKVVA
jgi:pimeloyl-ACP methyl ester carboxylesterase